MSEDIIGFIVNGVCKRKREIEREREREREIVRDREQTDMDKDKYMVRAINTKTTKPSIQPVSYTHTLRITRPQEQKKTCCCRSFCRPIVYFGMEGELPVRGGGGVLSSLRQYTYVNHAKELG